jgi:H+/Cl- antiporter ClcA
MGIRGKALNIVGLLIGTALTSLFVSLVYFYFEAAIRHTITYIWDTLLKTQSHRYLVIPACLILSLVFFGVQHYFDRKTERQKSEGLGGEPKPTLENLVKVIGIGFLSLVAGASLGPEAILLPASIIVGGYIGNVLLKDGKATAALSAVGFISIIAAFFNSFWIGMLGLLLLRRQVGLKLNPGIILIAAFSSLITVLTLSHLSSQAYAKLPASNWHFNISSIFVMLLLLFGGFLITRAYSLLHKSFEIIENKSWSHGWALHAAFAANMLSILYLLGGSLVEFTGNESIIPMLNKASSLGVLGLLWLLVIKLVAISWSKSSGYRGGMVFPTIFAASVLVAMAQQIDAAISFNIGLLVVMAGVLVANSKLKILF